MKKGLEDATIEINKKLLELQTLNRAVDREGRSYDASLRDYQKHKERSDITDDSIRQYLKLLDIKARALREESGKTLAKARTTLAKARTTLAKALSS